MSGKAVQVLQIDPPTELVFKGPFTDVVTSYLKLTNPSDRQICFKVKTTAPKQYCVRPNSGFINSKNSVTVAVMLQPFDHNAEEKSKHKFMVQTAYVPEGETSLDNIWKNVGPQELMDSKLKVAFETPAEQQVITDKTRQTSQKPSNNSVEAELRKAQDDKQRFQNQLNILEQENNSLREKLQRLESASTFSGSASNANDFAPASISTFHVFLVALAALFIGLLFGKVF